MCKLKWTLRNIYQIRSKNFLVVNVLEVVFAPGGQVQIWSPPTVMLLSKFQLTIVVLEELQFYQYIKFIMSEQLIFLHP